MVFENENEVRLDGRQYFESENDRKYEQDFRELFTSEDFYDCIGKYLSSRGFKCDDKCGDLGWDSLSFVKDDLVVEVNTTEAGIAKLELKVVEKIY